VIVFGLNAMYEDEVITQSQLPSVFRGEKRAREDAVRISVVARGNLVIVFGLNELGRKVVEKIRDNNEVLGEKPVHEYLKQVAPEYRSKKGKSQNEAPVLAI
jgi:hypothetical protein